MSALIYMETLMRPNIDQRKCVLVGDMRNVEQHIPGKRADLYGDALAAQYRSKEMCACRGYAELKTAYPRKAH